METNFINQYWDIIKNYLKYLNNEEEYNDIKNFELKSLDGLTNETFCLKNIKTNKKYLFKFFGKGNVLNIVNRDIENEILKKLEEKGFYLKVYFYNDILRWEEFTESKPLDFKKMCDIEIIYNILIKLNNVNNLDISLKKENIFELIFERKVKNLTLFEEKSKLIKSENNKDNINKLEYIETLFEQKNIDLLKNEIKSSNTLILSHMDWLNGNILISENNEYTLIDFEYSNFCLETYDIANYLNEQIIEYNSNGFKIHHDERLKEKEIKLIWKMYIIIKNNLTINEINEKEINNIFEKNKLDDNRLELMYKEYKICTLLAQFYWVIWSIIMYGENNLDFDYIDFGYQRAKDYFYFKKNNKIY